MQGLLWGTLEQPAATSREECIPAEQYRCLSGFCGSEVGDMVQSVARHGHDREGDLVQYQWIAVFQGIRHLGYRTWPVHWYWRMGQNLSKSIGVIPVVVGDQYASEFRLVLLQALQHGLRLARVDNVGPVP